LKFFFDNCISPKLARALSALVEPEHQIIHLRERFRVDADDETWLPVIAQLGAHVVTTDRRI